MFNIAALPLQCRAAALPTRQNTYGNSTRVRRAAATALLFYYVTSHQYPRTPVKPVSRKPLTGVALLLLAAIGAGMGGQEAAAAPQWEGRMDALPQYDAYCRTYGDRDPGCAPELGGRLSLSGPDRLGGKQLSLAMALHVHRQVVADLTYVADAEDRWEILGTIGSGMEGDCDDVVMTTIARLVRRGYPRAALRPTIVHLPDNGGYHLILAVRLADGEVYLDDRHRWQRSAKQLEAEGYRFIAQEVPGQPFWHRSRPAEDAPAPAPHPTLDPAAGSAGV